MIVEPFFPRIFRGARCFSPTSVLVSPGRCFKRGVSEMNDETSKYYAYRIRAGFPNDVRFVRSPTNIRFY